MVQKNRKKERHLCEKEWKKEGVGWDLVHVVIHAKFLNKKLLSRFSLSFSCFCFSFFSFLLFVISHYVLKFLAICRITVNFLLFFSLSLSLFFNFCLVNFLFLIPHICCVSLSSQHRHCLLCLPLPHSTFSGQTDKQTDTSADSLSSIWNK